VDPSRRLEKGPRGRFLRLLGSLPRERAQRPVVIGERLVTCPRRVELFITGERRSGQGLHEPGKLDVIIIDLAFASLNSTRNGAGKESDSRHG
jgi:hypothetical protein